MHGLNRSLSGHRGQWVAVLPGPSPAIAPDTMLFFFFLALPQRPLPGSGLAILLHRMEGRQFLRLCGSHGLCRAGPAGPFPLGLLGLGEPVFAWGWAPDLLSFLCG